MKKTKKIVSDADTPQMYCAIKPPLTRAFEPGVSIDRAEIIISNSKYWVNGTTLLYCFFTANGKKSDVADGSEVELVRKAFSAWKKIGLGIVFQETTSIASAHIRIAFMRGQGAWSYIGRDCLTIPKSEPTMNFGWNLLTDPRKVGVAIHEIGHALGFPHEHQNPNAGIVWNEAAVLSYFSGPPNNWSEKTIRFNILDKLLASDVHGSTWDPLSIMEYAFPAGLVKAPSPYDRDGIKPPGDRLSTQDSSWTVRFYPPLKVADYRELNEAESVALNVKNGDQANFRFTPTTSRQYEIRLFGQSDAVMVVFEQQDKNNKNYLIGKDDSGTDDNAYLKLRLEAGKNYLIKARMLYQNPDSAAVIMIW